ncbi:MAG: hypothetical protein LUM44_03150 [Pyrinomonadaceae bacterium]|nr:hypothetical protein [Pyrinomonadaceae bacterium]
MYRRPKFLEVLLDIRQEMARQADYDVDLFAEMVRSGKFLSEGKSLHSVEIETVANKSKAKSKRKT